MRHLSIAPAGAALESAEHSSPLKADRGGVIGSSTLVPSGSIKTAADASRNGINVLGSETSGPSLGLSRQR